MQPALDRRDDHLEAHRQFLDRLLLLLKDSPQFNIAHMETGAEQIAAIMTFIQSYTFTNAIPLSVRTAAHKTSHFEHTNFDF
jgi:hypothetical protein